MIRSSIVKIGDKLHGRRNEGGVMADIGGEVDWGNSTYDPVMEGFGSRVLGDRAGTRFV